MSLVDGNPNRAPEQTLPEAMMFDGQSEEELIRLARHGNEFAFNELHRRFRPYLSAVVASRCSNKWEAEEIVQEAFLRAWVNIRKLKQAVLFKAWLSVIARNLAFDHLRRTADKSTLSLDSGPDEDSQAIGDRLPSSAPDPYDAATASWTMTCINKAVNRLPYTLKTIFRMRHFEELTYEEIAEKLDLPMGTVKCYLHRARARVRKTMEKGGFVN